MRGWGDWIHFRWWSANICRAGNWQITDHRTILRQKKGWEEWVMAAATLTVKHWSWELECDHDGGVTGDHLSVTVLHHTDVTTLSLSSTRQTSDTEIAWLSASRGKDIRARDILLTLYNMARAEGLPAEQPMRRLLGCLIANERPGWGHRARVWITPSFRDCNSQMLGVRKWPQSWGDH